VAGGGPKGEANPPRVPIYNQFLAQTADRHYDPTVIEYAVY
jgi:hypothetical protein